MIPCLPADLTVIYLTPFGGVLVFHMLELFVIAVFGVLGTIHWILGCVAQQVFSYLFRTQWTWLFFTPSAVAEHLNRSSTDRSQVRYTLHSLFRFGILTIVLCNMQSELWMSDELHDLQMESGIEVYSVWGEGFSPTMGADGGSAFAL